MPGAVVVGPVSRGLVEETEVIVGIVSTGPVEETEVTVGIVSTGLVEETEVLEYTGVVEDSRVVDGIGKSALEVEGIEVLSGKVLGAVEPIRVVVLAVGYGYGFVS